LSADNPHKPNSGVLFPNSEKWIAGKKDRPYMGGEVQIHCPKCRAEFELRIAAWKQTGQGDRSFLSLAFSLPKVKDGK
jgi:hypothetical protein